MKPLTFFKYTTIGLILLNIVVLGFFLMRESQDVPPRPPRPRTDFQLDAISMLRLSNEQESVFSNLAEEHETQIRKLNREQETLIIPLFESITDPSIELDTLMVLEQFDQIQRQKLVLTRNHLLEIKDLLNEDQLPDFEIFVDRVMERTISKRKKRPARPQDFR
ncbi:MAG: hypothetical protein AAF388_15300 [Bacteroidota bacterium]